MAKGSYLLTQREGNLRYLIRILDESGETILTSQYREVKSMCMNEIRWMRGVSSDERFYERFDDVNGAWYFILRANDAHILGESPRFDSLEKREECIASLMRIAPDAELDDRTPEIEYGTRIHTLLQEHAREVVFG